MDSWRCMVFFLLMISVASGQLCQTHIQQYKDALGLGKNWAVRMYDSSTKTPEGILTGLLNPPGNFDECLAARAPDFRGKYCRRNFIGLLPTFKIAACGPSTCGEADIAQVAEFNFETVGVKVSAETVPSSCDFVGARSLDTGAWIAISVIIFLVSVVILAGLCDWYFESNNRKPSGAIGLIVSAFSLRSNLRQVFHISRRKIPGQITCINGIRVLSTAWVVLGHRYEIFIMSMPNINSIDAWKMIQSFSSMPVINSLFSVDTFFLLSGFLVTYMFCTDNKKGKKFNVIQYYVYRYLRLTAPVAFMILFLAFLLGHLGHGPQWNALFSIQSQTCKDRWWTTLLYINNLYNHPSMTCLPMSWYLSVDMQLSWLAPLLLLPLIRWPKYTLIAIGVLLLACTGVTFGLTYAYDFFWTYPVLNIPNPTSQADYWFIVYITPWMRAQPYLIGMALGWYLSAPRKPMGKAWACLMWLLSTACCLAVLFTITLAYQPDRVYSETEAAFCNSLHRLVWGLSVAWVIYACTAGLLAGPVDWILSWKYFQPLSKLSYCVYLTHMFLIFVEVGYQRVPLYFSQAFMVHGLIADLVYCIPLSLLLYLTTEAPTMVLLRKIFGKDTKPAAKQVEEKQEPKSAA